MTGKLIDRLVAATVFVYSFVLYVATMAETTPFWDSGEFIAISNGLEVSHPPGAPFYMLVGRLFSMLSPILGTSSPEPIAFSVNLVSVLCSALTILVTHLVIVRLVRIWTGHPDTWTPAQRVGANAGGAIGALTFAVTDSFWFNAVEAEVYAMSMLFTALVVWLALVWRDATRAEEAALAKRGEHPFGLHADRYLVAIAYLFGLAIGVHLLNVLTLFFIALVVFFQKVDRADWTTGQRVKGLLLTGAVAVGVFLVIYPGVVQTLPTLAGASGSPTLFVIAVLALLVGAVWYTQKKGMPLANLASLIIALVILGYSSYGLIFVRSAANPPIDENDPETAEAIVSYLKREQYGSTPLLTGTTYDNRTGRVDEQTTFPRRHSSVPQHIQVYAQYDSDAAYFWQYQIGHMYARYFMWNFVGKAADTQDAGWISGIGERPATGPTPSEQAGQNAYFWLPLLLGLIGIGVHVQRDWRRALAVGVLFLVTGIGIILYLNQTPYQPRERDYSYVASFFAFSLWIGIGATGLIELASEALEKKTAALRSATALAIAAALFLVVPGWMAVENYDDHDRSGRRIATDFARNLLESTAPNAILLTNGDNDTFPLWYLQEVMGVRRDVRVVNLSLLNTPWYIRQLRDQASRESAPLPLSFTDADLDGISGPPSMRATGPLAPRVIEDTEVALPVDARAFADDRVAGRIAPGDVPDRMTWTLRGQPLGEGQSVLYTADLAVLDLLRNVAEEGWQRPVYFAGTVSQASELGLQPYFQNEGLARRVVPLARGGGDPDGAVVPEVALARLSKFEFRGLDDPDVYLDQNARNMADGYRIRVGTIAGRLAGQGRADAAVALLDRLAQQVPTTTVPASFGSLLTLADAYERAGASDKAATIFREAETIALGQLQSARSAGSQDQAFQFVQYIQSAYILGGDYEAASAFMGRIADVIGDETFRRSADEIRAEAEAMMAPPTDSAGQ
ncbi:protein O-mannosyl-transferase family [Rubrivirga sp. IMCC43871]|uniref:protein O-mannosyl-transferase family n=1 Tax=Rubrivirga sp. IMCC43871 TaxID=3391575 RepID=UPI00398FC75E